MGRIKLRRFPKLYIAELARWKMHEYCRIVETEVTGLGEVIEYPGILLVRDVFILKQSAGKSNAELDADAMCDLTTQLASRGNADQIRFFWHSHCNMTCYFSATDNTTIEAFGAPYLISTVINRQGDELHRLDVFEPLRMSFEKIHMAILDKEVLGDILRQEVNDLVTQSPWRYTPTREEVTDYERRPVLSARPPGGCGQPWGTDCASAC